MANSRREEQEGAAGVVRPRGARLDPRYLAAVERLEARPENQTGADKTWVERALRDFRDHYARAVRVR